MNSEILNEIKQLKLKSHEITEINSIIDIYKLKYYNTTKFYKNNTLLLNIKPNNNKYILKLDTKYEDIIVLNEHKNLGFDCDAISDINIIDKNNIIKNIYLKISPFSSTIIELIKINNEWNIKNFFSINQPYYSISAPFSRLYLTIIIKNNINYNINNNIIITWNKIYYASLYRRKIVDIFSKKKINYNNFCIEYDKGFCNIK
jgi:hypothetical protein